MCLLAIEAGRDRKGIRFFFLATRKGSCREEDNECGKGTVLVSLHAAWF